MTVAIRKYFWQHLLLLRTWGPNLHWVVDYNAAILPTTHFSPEVGLHTTYISRELLRSSEADCCTRGVIKWSLSSNPSTEYHMTWLDGSVSLTKLSATAVATITTDTRLTLDVKYVSVSGTVVCTLQDITAMENRRHAKKDQELSTKLGPTLYCGVSATRATEPVTILHISGDGRQRIVSG